MCGYEEALSNAVKKAREKRNLSQEKLAELVGVDRQMIRMIEKGTANPKMTSLFPLIRELNIDPNAIFYPEIESTEY